MEVTPMGAEANRQAVERAIERWNTHDDRYFELYSEDLVCHDQPPGLPPTLEGLKALFHQMWASFPDIRIAPVGLVGEGDLFALHLRASGTHEGEFMGAAPTGNRVEISAMAFLRFDADGKVAERWARIDDVAMLTQLGLMPAPASAPA
jgi:predicted ester cyclase